MSPAVPLTVQVGNATITPEDLLQGPYFRRVLRLAEPSRTRAWIATIFEADPEGEIEQVALWGMYRMQFEPHQSSDESSTQPIPPLAAATDVITVMETVFRTDSYIGPDGVKRYVIRGLKLRPTGDRDGVLDDMFRGPSEPVQIPSTQPSPQPQTQPQPITNTNIQMNNNTSSNSNPQSSSAQAHQLSQPQLSQTQSVSSRSSDLLEESDILKIIHFPEPYRTRLWIASLFEPDPTSNPGPGGGGVEQVTLWQLYQKQITPYVVEGTIADKVVPPLAAATEVIKAVQDVFQEGRVIVRLEGSKTHYLIIGIKLRPSSYRSAALKNLLNFSAVKLPNPSHNGSTSHSTQSDLSNSQLITKVESLARTVDELQDVIKQQELTIKQELAWYSTRQINLRASELKGTLRPLALGPPHSTPSYPVDFPKTVEEAHCLDYTQCVALLERYRQTNLIHEGNEERTRSSLLEFIGCVPDSNTVVTATPTMNSMV
ncbi:hypothetical protein O181_048191 [Austropuccinia psidii MF-1]|uniref:RFX-type winged-helix domain-containing protein n=1 Tax=Austropuccinia psidii MF-1 TaxID=1389203 RepID=A0A9Q3DXI8_9BASI|nr:hypothetical protein [Austropuccinia psidii MF-1]